MDGVSNTESYSISKQISVGSSTGIKWLIEYLKSNKIIKKTSIEIEIKNMSYSMNDVGIGYIDYNGESYELTSIGQKNLFRYLNTRVSYMKTLPRDVVNKCINFSIKNNKKKYIARIVNNKVSHITTLSSYSKKIDILLLLEIMSYYIGNNIVLVSLHINGDIEEFIFVDVNSSIKIDNSTTIYSGFSIMHSEVGLRKTSIEPVSYNDNTHTILYSSRKHFFELSRKIDTEIRVYFHSGEINKESNFYSKIIFKSKNIYVKSPIDLIDDYIDKNPMASLRKKRVKKIYNDNFKKKKMKNLYVVINSFLISANLFKGNLEKRLSMNKYNTTMVNNLINPKYYRR